MLKTEDSPFPDFTSSEEWILWLFEFRFDHLIEYFCQVRGMLCVYVLNSLQTFEEPFSHWHWRLSSKQVSTASSLTSKVYYISNHLNDTIIYGRLSVFSSSRINKQSFYSLNVMHDPRVIISQYYNITYYSLTILHITAFALNCLDYRLILPLSVHLTLPTLLSFSGRPLLVRVSTSPCTSLLVWLSYLSAYSITSLSLSIIRTFSSAINARISWNTKSKS